MLKNFIHAPLPNFGWRPMVLALVLTGCAQGLVPQSRNVDIPPPVKADERPDAVNEAPDSVMYLPLGRDVLVPMPQGGQPLPDTAVGPFELRGETLGGALQLLLGDVDIPIAFQTDQGLTRTVTVTNLHGKLADVVQQVCSLADLYCAYERGTLVVKDRQTFTITLPPLGLTAERATMLSSIAGAIKAMTGRDPVVDASSRTIIYEATSRTADQVDRYFQKLRASTSLVVFETYVWEVSLNSGNASGIKWDMFDNGAKWKFGVDLNGTVDPDVGTPISIGLPTTSELNSLSAADVLRFISSYGAVKTISQPQLTVLSGSTARLRIADKQNYVSKITRTVSGDQVTVATDTASVESGFTLEIESSWDNSTVYGNINIALQEVRDIITFDDNPESIVQLPQTTEREVTTQVRVRPGDSLLIAGLVRENDSFTSEGPGIDRPIIPTSRSARAGNVELVFLLKPRVIVFADHKAAHERQPVNADDPQNPVVYDRTGTGKVAPAAQVGDLPSVSVEPRDVPVVDQLFTHEGASSVAPTPKDKPVVITPLLNDMPMSEPPKVPVDPMPPVTVAPMAVPPTSGVTTKPVLPRPTPILSAEPTVKDTQPVAPPFPVKSTMTPEVKVPTASDVANKILSAPTTGGQTAPAVPLPQGEKIDAP